MDSLKTLIIKIYEQDVSIFWQYAYYIVHIVDEDLYCKLMKLRWAKDDYSDFLIIKLGGLYTSMNSLKAIVKHSSQANL